MQNCFKNSKKNSLRKTKLILKTLKAKTVTKYKTEKNFKVKISLNYK